MAKKKGSGGGQQKPKVEISLTESHERSWNKWRVTITATVKENQKPVENKAVSFLLGSRQIGGLVATDTEGRVSQTLFLPGGTHIVVAKLPDGTQRDITVTLESKQQKSAKILSHQAMEEDGKYQVVFQVLTSGNEPIADAILKIFATGGSFDLPPTDARGIVELGVLVHQRDLVCDVVLLGTNVSVWKNFFKTI